MTDEEIDGMQAGREMDALIAEKVFGWERDGKALKKWSASHQQ